MRTAGFCPPEMLTKPTPVICEIFGASRVSAKSSTCDNAIVDELSASVSTGASAGFDLLYTGGVGRFAGR